MKTYIVTIGREINGPWEGMRVGRSRGVWLLHEEDWQAFQQRTLHLLVGYGAVVFAGKGRGVNSITGQAGEESACFIMVPNGDALGVGPDLDADLAALATAYGQLEIGLTLGDYAPVKAGE